jgi:hypothetical protein
MISRLKSRKFLLKVFSLFFSLFIWFYVVSTAEIEVTKEVPITVDLPKGLAVSNDIVRSLNYQLSGPGLFVRRFLNKKIEVKINKNDFYRKGKRKYQISLDKYKPKLPLGVELLSMEPRYLQINLEPIITKKVRIKAHFSANLQDEFQIDKIKLIPKTVSISGPKSIIRTVKFLETKVIDNIANIPSSGMRTKIVTDSDKIKISEDDVLVSFVIKSKLTTRKIIDIPIIFQSNGLIKNASHKKVELVIEAEEKMIQGVDAKTFQVLAIIDKKSQKAVDIELITELPEGIKLISIKPSIVRVQMESE